MCSRVLFNSVYVIMYRGIRNHLCIAASGKARGEKEDGETELGQRVAVLPAASVGAVKVWGGTGSPRANTDNTSSASPSLARQSHVNITFLPAHVLTNMPALTLRV